MKRISIVGSTGSIGTQALQVIENHPEEFELVAITANTNSDLLIAQANKFKPRYVGICDENAYKSVRSAVQCEVGCGVRALTDAAAIDCDIVLVSVVGCVGLNAVLAAIESGKTVALANKESLVAAGKLVTAKAKARGAQIIPVDSEHSAIWQCLTSGRREDVRRLILTASGGPFYNKAASELVGITPEQAVRHPNWNMGKKISVDSATMMNKGLEIIEARWLFDTENIDYVIHPQSIVHSMVEYNDGAVIAQMSVPDMRLPIQLALSYPTRLSTPLPELKLHELTFLPPREDVFPLPALAKKSLKAGGTAPCILNAANEAAVALFLDGKIGFTRISEIVENTLLNTKANDYNSARDIFEVHEEVYAKLLKDYN